MPWHIESRSGKHCVVKDADGSTVHCHDTRDEAVAQIRALYASEGKSVTFFGIEAEENPPMNEPDVLIYYGGAVKALGDGKVGGYLVEFSDPATKAGAPDLDGEFFAKDTDYDLDEGKKATVYFDHGRDPVLKKRKLGQRAMMRMDDIGVWIEHQLNKADEYENAIYQLAKAGKLGWSSGTAPHLVEKKSVGGFKKIISWPLGDDASYTPQPASFTKTNRAVALKSVPAPTLEKLIEETRQPPQITTKALEEVVPGAYNNDLDTHFLKVETAVEESIAHMVKSLSAAEMLFTRLASKQEFRALKDGRALSKQRTDKMQELILQLKKMADYPLSIAAEFEKVINEAIATREQREALQQAAQLQYQTFQQLKETPNA